MVRQAQHDADALWPVGVCLVGLLLVGIGLAGSIGISWRFREAATTTITSIFAGVPLGISLPWFWGSPYPLLFWPVALMMAALVLAPLVMALRRRPE